MMDFSGAGGTRREKATTRRAVQWVSGMWRDERTAGVSRRMS